MTEAEWLACTDPEPMFRFLRGRANERKVRLFACGCCRYLWWGRLVDPRSRAVIQAGEQLADGLISVGQLHELRDGAERAVKRAGHGTRWRASRAAVFLIGPFAWLAAEEVVRMASEKQLRVQTDLLRDVFSNPFRPISLTPAWLTWHDSLLISMARQMYDNRDFRDMPVLADALEEAGCDNADMLAHCRQPGPHVRGCWVVDLLLGKS